MPRLITRAPWTRQPQTPVPLSNLARSLGFTNAWNFSDWTQNLGNPANSVTTSVNATKSIGPGGRALTFSGTAGDRLEIANDPFATSVGTYLWIESGVDVSASGQAITVSRYGAAGPPELQGLQLRIVGSDFLIIAASLAVNLTATAARNNAGSVNVTAASINGGTGRHAVVSNGALIASGTGSTAYVHGTSAIGGGPDVPMGSIKLYSLFFAPVVIADAILEKLTAEPGQLFAPLSRTIWVPAAAGGATYTLTAASGSFALTGQDAGLAFNRVLAADTQSYALTGQATGLAFNRTLAAASGSFTLTGQDAGLAFNRVLSAASGSFALDGQDVTLTYTPISGATYTLGAASGSFALTGQDTGLAFNRVLTADTQSYSLSGDVAGLAFNRVLAADTVSYALTGQDVTLTYTSNGFTYTLTAESGSFEVTGQDASLRHTTTAIAGGGGWLPQTRRKSRKQIYEERVKLGILPPPVIKAAAKVAAVAQTVEEFKEERPKYEEMFLKAIKKTEWLPDYTRAIQAQLAIMEQEEEELLLLL